MAEFKRAFGRSEIQPGTVKKVEIGSQEIAIFNVDGHFYAMDNKCVHRGGPLCEGDLSGKEITCPWHAWRYDITTGANLDSPNVKMKVYEVKVEGDDILVSV